MTVPTLPQVLAAVRGAGLPARERDDGFDLVSKGRVVTVRTRDPARATLASFEIVDSGTETLVFELALALVPQYGPIVVTEAMFGSFVVDGTCDADALRAQRGKRIGTIMRGVGDDLADMERTHAMWENQP